MSRYALSPGRRHLIVRRSVSTAGLGAALFAGSLLAMRLRPRTGLFALGALGAALLVIGVRRLVVAARPLVVGESAVWFGTRGVPLGDVEAVEVDGERLRLSRRGGKPLDEFLAEPAQAAAEIARRAGLRPPRRGGAQRWEKREEEGA